MDYKEKYEQALERARQFSEKPYLEDSAGIVEYIFPELKESEDERIRKEIIEHIKWSYDEQECADEEMHRWISWLEKQSEHTNFLNKIQIGDKVTRNRDGVLVNLSQLNRVAKVDERQGEQKPAWSEEDEKIINGITSYLCTHDSCELDGFDKWYDFLKSLKDRVHPKQEWSEEDDFMVENVRNSFGLHYGQMTPALQEQYRKFFDKVKAIKLQPNWKPSKEQIKSLYNSIPDAALYEREILTQLYVDLKKLTE